MSLILLLLGYGFGRFGPQHVLDAADASGVGRRQKQVL